MAYAVPIIMAVAAAAASAYASYEQSKALKQQAEVEDQAAKVADMEAKAAIASAQADTLEISRRQRMLIGRQAALYGAAGVEMTGSPLEVMANTAAQAQQDIMYRGYAGDMQMRSHAYESQLHKWKSENLDEEASNTLTMALLVKAPMAGASTYMSSGGGFGGPGSSGSTPSGARSFLSSEGSSWLDSGSMAGPLDNAASLNDDKINQWRMNSLWGSASLY